MISNRIGRRTKVGAEIVKVKTTELLFQRTLRVAVVTVLLAAISTFALVAHAQESASDSGEQRRGPASDVVRFRAFDVDRAPRDLEAGRMDLYMYNLKTAAARRLEADNRFALFQVPASTNSLLLNPAPAREGEINPFALPKVRQAMQYLVDREFIAREIYQGMAQPMITHVSPQDYDFLTVYDVQRGSGISYAPEYGRELIAEAMQEAGASLVDGTWHYEGRPVRLRLIGRVEDERRDIADLIRTELEAAGFMINVVYSQFAAAVLSVYSSDPAAFEWHLYTEGWGKGSPQRYDYTTVNSMFAPWLGNMPGWREVGFWQYEHDELDTLGTQLFRGEFSNRAERDELYRRMTRLGLDESVRIWLVTAVNTFPAVHELEGVTEDLVAGPRAPWTLREAYLPDSSELEIGHLWVWTERTTWNPVGGFGDVYGTDIWRALVDPPLWNHPFTGVPISVRADFTVETAGPDGRLDVPGDAVVWNASADRWQTVAAGTQATSRVVMDYSRYVDARWHHGQPITMADVVYDIAQSYELAYDQDKARIEVALGVTSRPYLETFKGFRILDDHRLEVYVDFWHFEEATIASYASPTGLSTPWEIRAAMDDLVFDQRRAAYSDTAAARFNVPWISLVMPRDAGLVQRTLRTFALRDVVPESVFQFGSRRLVDAGEAAARYQAALDWYDEHSHLVISNGPFYLAAYEPRAQYAELRAFRDETYPFAPGDWSFGPPPTLAVQGVEAPIVTVGEESAVSVTVAGTGQLNLNYLLLDPVNGEVVQQGEAVRAEADEKDGEASGIAEFAIPLTDEMTATLWPGLYRLYLIAHSDAIALVDERTVDLEVE